MPASNSPGPDGTSGSVQKAGRDGGIVPCIRDIGVWGLDRRVSSRTSEGALAGIVRLRG